MVIFIIIVLVVIIYIYKFNNRDRNLDNQYVYDGATTNKSKFVSSTNVFEDAFTKELTNTLEMEVQKLFRKYPREEDDVLLALFIGQLIASYKESFEKNAVKISNTTNIPISRVKEIIKICTNNCYDKYLI